LYPRAARIVSRNPTGLIYNLFGVPVSQSMTNIFQGRKAVIATKHHKERAIGPLLLAHLGIELVVPTEIETDKLGTFTRDVMRPGTMLEAARRKAAEGMRLMDLDLAIASEGAFGPHPSSPLVAANTELILLIDQKHGLEIAGESVTLKTNFAHQYVANLAEALAFAQAVDFPEHGIVVRRDDKDNQDMVKNLPDLAALQAAVTQLFKISGLPRIWLETDMRAHRNPTRMENIRLATEILIANAQRTCPQCQTPGFSVTESSPGLPCELCGLPTPLKLIDRSICQKCGYTQVVRTTELAYAGYCLNCNP